MTQTFSITTQKARNVTKFEETKLSLFFWGGGVWFV